MVKESQCRRERGEVMSRKTGPRFLRKLSTLPAPCSVLGSHPSPSHRISLTSQPELGSGFKFS